MKASWWMVIVGFAAGLAAGATIRGISGAVQRPVQAVHVAPMAGAAPPPVPTTPPARSVSEAHDPVRARLRAIAELNSLLKIRIRVPWFDPFGRVDTGFSNVFGLTDDEVARLNTGSKEAKARIAALEAKHAVIAPAGENGYRITIAPYPDEGGVVYDGLVASIQEALGSERFAAWRDMSDEVDTGWLFGKFGLSETSITVRLPKDGETTMFSSGANLREDGVVVATVDTNPVGLAREHPDLHRKMVAAGLLSDSSGF